MKRVIKYTLALVSALSLMSLAGCGNSPTETKNSEAETSAPQPNSVQTAEQPVTSQPEAVTEEAPEQWDPPIAQRQEMTSGGYLCGAAFIGYIEPDADSAACRDMFLSSEYAQEFDTLTEIPDEFCVSSEGGTDLYLITPARPENLVTVYEWDISEGNDFLGEKGEALFSSENGAPFLLKCNRSDIMPDTLVEITDSQGQTFCWNPSISLKDGTVATGTGDMPIYDLTHYSGNIEE